MFRAGTTASIASRSSRVGAHVPLVSRQSERTSLKLGDAVGVEIDPSALMFFDHQGRALRAMQQAA